MITLTFTPEQLYTITEGLMLVPFGKAAPVIASIQEQTRQGQQAQQVGTDGQMQAINTPRTVGEKPDLSTLSNDH